MTSTDTTQRRVRWAGAAGLVAAGLVGGAVLAGSLTANAASPSPAPGARAGDADGHHGDGVPATAAATDKVRTAVLAKYPGATVDRVEGENGGYEAHVATAAGTHLRVLLSSTFAITSAEAGHGFGGHSNTDPAHEAGESAARVAEEKAQDASRSAG